MFQISIDNGAVLSHQMKKEIANSDARLIMQTRMKVAQHKINNKDKIEKKYIDVSDARREYESNKRNYERTCPEKLDPQAQNAMWKRAKQLKDEFTVGMLSFDDLHPIKGLVVDGAVRNIVDWEKISTNRSTERNTEWYNKNASKLIEFKNIMRHLCPDNPAASDVEKFRPRRKTV